MFEVVKQIQSDGVLLHPPGHPYQGKSIVPFGYGVVFTNITRKQFVQTDLYEVFPEDRCVFKDEMTESVDGEALLGAHNSRVGCSVRLTRSSASIHLTNLDELHRSWPTNYLCGVFRELHQAHEWDPTHCLV
jgi:hypothetical protein